ncbi:MAG: acyl-CoA dehydrogenase family protein [Myxococcota bacterium]
MASLGDMMGLLNKLGETELGQRLQVHERAQQVLREGAKSGLSAATRAAERMKPLARRFRPERGERGDARPALFDLHPTEEQQMLQEMLRRFGEEAMRPLAEQADAEARVPEELLDHVHELGIAAMPIPEALGGAGEARSPLTTALVAEELSRGDMGFAYAALAPAAVVHALIDHGTPEQGEAHLPRFTRERFTAATFALAEPTAMFDPNALDTRAKRSGSDWVLRGVKTMVALGERAELLLVAAAIDGKRPALFLVERGLDGLSVAPEPAMGLRSAAPCRITLEDVRVPKDALLGGEADEASYAAVVDKARIGWGAMAVGTAQAMLDYVIPYCGDRKAFGEPITHRQAVAFLIADIAIEVEGMRLAVWRAASRAEQGRDFRREAYLARLQCTDKGMKVGTDGVQLLGGHGFIKDHPVERWYRHLRGIGVMEGGLVV